MKRLLMQLDRTWPGSRMLEPNPFNTVDPERNSRKSMMLYYAAFFLVLAIIAAVLGLGGAAGAAAGISQLLFLACLALLVIGVAIQVAQRTLR